ncbi:MAG: hypothetical protein ACM3SY_10525 [Candidatus Omnitrophota bacterium]
MSKNDLFTPVELISPDHSDGFPDSTLAVSLTCNKGYVCGGGQADV